MIDSYAIVHNIGLSAVETKKDLMEYHVIYVVLLSCYILDSWDLKWAHADSGILSRSHLYRGYSVHSQPDRVCRLSCSVIHGNQFHQRDHFS